METSLLNNSLLFSLGRYMYIKHFQLMVREQKHNFTRILDEGIGRDGRAGVDTWFCVN